MLPRLTLLVNDNLTHSTDPAGKFISGGQNPINDFCTHTICSYSVVFRNHKPSMTIQCSANLAKNKNGIVIIVDANAVVYNQAAIIKQIKLQILCYSLGDILSSCKFYIVVDTSKGYLSDKTLANFQSSFTNPKVALVIAKNMSKSNEVKEAHNSIIIKVANIILTPHIIALSLQNHLLQFVDSEIGRIQKILNVKSLEIEHLSPLIHSETLLQGTKLKIESFKQVRRTLCNLKLDADPLNRERLTQFESLWSCVVKVREIAAVRRSKADGDSFRRLLSGLEGVVSDFIGIRTTSQEKLSKLNPFFTTFAEQLEAERGKATTGINLINS